MAPFDDWPSRLLECARETGDRPSQFRYDANVVFPVYDRNTTLELNVVNIGNIDNGTQIGEFEGTTIPLLNNRYGLSNLYPLGPRRVQLSLTHNFDFGIH